MHGAIKLQNGLQYHSCMQGIFLFFTVGWFIKCFVSFSIQTQMTRPDKLEFNLYCEKLSTFSLSYFFLVSNQGAFSSLCILIPFPCFRFPSPTLFNGWILFMSGCSTQRKYVTFLCYRNGRDCQLFERATFLCPDLNYSYYTFLPYARLYAKHVTYYRIEFYQQWDEVVQLSSFYQSRNWSLWS